MITFGIRIRIIAVTILNLSLLNNQLFLNWRVTILEFIIISRFDMGLENLNLL